LILKSTYADEINKYILEGKIVPVEITCKLILDTMENSSKEVYFINLFSIF